MIFGIYFISLFLVGPIQYFLPGLGQIQWAVTILLTILLLRVFFSITTKQRTQGGGSLPGYMVFMGLFLGVAFLSSAANMYLMDAILDAKNYFQFWSFALALFFLVSKDSLVMRMMKGLLILSFINTPLCVFQYFLRDTFPGDLVTGTFGGVIGGEGGGPNAFLSSFQILQVCVIINLALRRQLSWSKALVLTVWYLIPVGLASARATLFFLLIMTVLTIGSELRRRPYLAILGTTLMVCVFSALFYFQYRDSGKYGESEGTSIKEFVQIAIEHNIESKQGDLTRLSTVSFWLKENSPSEEPLGFFFGHGIGASKSMGAFQGHIALNPKYRDLNNINIKTLTRLLWDVGIMGTVMFTLIFVSAFRLVTTLKGNPVFTPLEASFLASSQVACLIFIIDIPYQNNHLSIQSYAAFVMLILGYVGYCKKKADASRGATVVDSVYRKCRPAQYPQKRISV